MFQRLFAVPLAERRLAGAAAGPLPAGRTHERRSDHHADALAQLTQAHEADASLLRLALCAAGATLAVALAVSLL